MRADDLKKLLAEDRDLLKMIVEETLQQVLEGEMDEALQASKGERTAGRLGYRRLLQPEAGDAGRGIGAVRAEALGRAVPVSDFGWPVREGARRWRGAQRGGIDRDRH